MTRTLFETNVFGVVRVTHAFLPLLRRSGRTGMQTVEDGAEIIVRMARVGPDGPTGGYFDASGPHPW